MKELSHQQIEHFINWGFVKIENAFSQKIANECCSILWEASGCDPNNPDTWTEPVVRIGELGHEPFLNAVNTEILKKAFDELVGKDNWIPKNTLGSFPLRFPSKEPANDTGWHVDASFAGNDPSNYFEWRINVSSKSRGLLMLFLFSDVSEIDAPTRLIPGSHFAVAKILRDKGDEGLSFMELHHAIQHISFSHEELATGNAGTVYLCHPFLVHAAQNHRGAVPKFMAQPALMTKNDFSLHKPVELLCPVEKAILKGLDHLIT